jgi:hypothetical protein
MKGLLLEEKKRILSRIYWDMKIDPDDLVSFLDKKVDEIQDIDEINFFCRLLSSCDWYTLLKLLSPDKINNILNDKIINRLYPKDLKIKFIYARDVLSR